MHREGTQILGITTLQLLLLTVTLPWTSLQFLRLDTLPSLKFNMGNLTTYFITRLVSDQRAANDFKNLNKKAYPLFKDGHVQEIKTCIHQQHYYITAICLPEMKKTLQYHIKLILEEASGDICHAECGCPAGLGPSGSCKHIAALGYALEEYAHHVLHVYVTSCLHIPVANLEPTQKGALGSKQH